MERIGKIGLFPMVGDLLHIGHLAALKEAKDHCHHLIVALNVLPDNKQPVESPYERYMRLASCEFVDEIIPYAGEQDLLLLINTLDYDVRFIGQDHYNDWTGKEIEYNRGIEVYEIKRIPGVSSTDLKKRIKEQK